MTDPITLKVPTVVEGRLLLKKPSAESSDHLILALHGYGESADLMMERLEALTDSGYTLACVEALHPIYLPNRKVGHSWMTSHIRETAIVENLGYLERVMNTLREQHPFPKLTVLGYSQGAQMAMRVVRWMGGDHLIAIGGEMPPELKGSPLCGENRAPETVVLARGKKEIPYSKDTLQADLQHWERWGSSTSSIELPGAHRWQEDWVSLFTPYLT